MTDDVLLLYITEAKKYPLLTEEEERAILLEAQSGSCDATTKLVNSNLRLVIKMAKQYTSNDSELMELIQEGNMGLMKAVQKFDCSYDVRFSSYAAWWIRQSFLRYLNSNKRVIRLPIRKEILVRELEREEERFESRHGRKPSCDDLMKILNKSYEEVLEIKFLQNCSAFSLDMPVLSDENFNMYDILPSYEYSPEKEFIEQEFKDNLNKCLGVLNEREQDIVKHRYGLDGIQKTVPFKALGEKHSISAESVRQTQLRAIRKLKANKTAIKAIV